MTCLGYVRAAHGGPAIAPTATGQSTQRTASVQCNIASLATTGARSETPADPPRTSHPGELRTAKRPSHCLKRKDGNIVITV